MSVENPRGEPREDYKLYEARFGLSFKPFARVRHLSRQQDGDGPFSVPESYEHYILLRKGITLAGMPGCIDLITEDPNALGEIFEVHAPPPQKPLGPAAFTEIYRGPEDIEFTEMPSILRFSFRVHTPADYSKLLETYADVELGKEQYLLPWNIDRPCVKRNMQHLETGGGVLVVVQKNLFNVKEFEENEEESEGDIETIELGRVRFIWLPIELKKYRTIKVTFNQWDHGEEDQPIDPITPERDRILVPV